MEQLGKQKEQVSPSSLIDPNFFHYIEEEDRKKTQKSLSILVNFCYDGEKAVTKSAYTASTLLPTFIKSENMPYSKQIREAFTVIDSKYGREEAEYIAEILSDQKIINQLWEGKGAEIPEAQTALDGQIDWDLSQGKFLNRKRLLHPRELADLMRKIEPEAILVAAASHCAKLEDLMVPTEGENQNEVLDAICKAEALYSPILELMGYDAFNMELTSAAKQARLIRSGELGRKSVEVARGLIERDYEGNKVEYGVTNVTNILLGDNDLELIPNNSNSSIWMVDGICDTFNGDEVKFVARRKSRGSLAWKIYKEAKKKGFNAEDISLEGIAREVMPVDIVGLQVMFNDEDTLAKNFRAIYENASERAEILPAAAPSKESPIHVRGEDKFIAKILQELNLKSTNVIDIKPEAPGGMEVVKITFSYDGMFFELALLTAAKRTLMRISPQIAHLVYKSGLQQSSKENLEEIGEFFAEINALKANVGSNRYSETTHGRETLQRILD